MEVKDEHPENATSPIVVTLFGIVMDVKEEHPENAPLPNSVTLFVIVIEVKEEHPLNALFPIIVTLFGMVMVVKEEHSRNALFPIVVIPSKMTTVVSFVLIALGVIFISPVPVIANDVIEHPSNALFPIVVTLLGIVMDVKEEQLENAFSLIVVIPSEITTVASSVLISFGVNFISPVPVIVNDVIEQSENALFPIVATLFGIVIDVREEHLENA